MARLLALVALPLALATGAGIGTGADSGSAAGTGSPPVPAPAATPRPRSAVPGSGGAAVSAGVWVLPTGTGSAVVRPFHAPPTPWAAGHRGVDLTTSRGAPVLAAGAGTVSFSAVVAGRGVLTVTHPSGLRTSYEPVVAALRRGTTVEGGQVVARVAGDTSHCAPAVCLHWGLRRGRTYLDPMSLLGRQGPPVLLPFL